MAERVSPKPALRRVPLLALAGVALVTATLGGLGRLGLATGSTDTVLHHGILMITGFFGTLIGVERAVALGRPWAYLAPAAAGLAGLAVLGGADRAATGALAILAGALLTGVQLVIVRRQRAGFTITMAVGAACLLVGNALWAAGCAVADVVLLWSLFLVLTIAGERLELSRLVRVGRGARWVFGGLVAAVTTAALIRPWEGDVATRVAGLGLVGLSLWLALHDVARRTVRQPGLPRYVAVCLMAGYVWLAVSGVLFAAFGALGAGFRYDAALHALFLGFVLSMVFGHAPIIFPAVLTIPVRWGRSLYLPLVALHASLAVRIVADLAFLAELRAWAGLANAVALALFVVTMVSRVVAGRRARKRPSARSAPPTETARMERGRDRPRTPSAISSDTLSAP